MQYVGNEYYNLERLIVCPGYLENTDGGTETRALQHLGLRYEKRTVPVYQHAKTIHLDTRMCAKQSNRVKSSGGAGLIRLLELDGAMLSRNVKQSALEKSVRRVKRHAGKASRLCNKT